MRDKFKPIIAALISFCILGTVTACGDSDNDGEGTSNGSSAEYKDHEQKVYDENYDRNTELTTAFTAAACVYDSANSSLSDADYEGRMRDVIKSSKAVIICSDKGKNVNASGVDDKFYEDMYNYFSDAKGEQWFVVVKNGICKEAFIKLSDCKFIGRKPDFTRDESNNIIYEFDGMTFDDVYNKAVSDNT